MNKEMINFFIVDDDPVSAAIFRQYLIFEGYRKIKVFSSGKECLASLRHETCTVGVGNYLGAPTGIEVIKKAKHAEQGIYVIYVCAYTDAAILYKSLSSERSCIITGDNELKTMVNSLHKIEQAVALLQNNVFTHTEDFGLTYNRNAFLMN